MSEYLAFPRAREVRGRVRPPSSKSSTNRALIVAALADRPIEIAGALESDDTAALARCLVAMGASIERRADGLAVRGPLGRPRDSRAVLDVADSGTAARFLAALAAAVPGRWRITGSERLRERPMAELVVALRCLGAKIDAAAAEDGLPLDVEGGTLRSGRVRVDASRSSQFVSALLLAGAALPDGIEVSVSGATASAPYVRTTLDVLKDFGHEVSSEPLRARPGKVSVGRYVVPPDFSSALPLLGCAAIAGGEVTVSGLPWPASDPDALAIPVLVQMGLEIEAAGGGLRARGLGAPRAVDVSATDFPDAVPTLAAVAALAAGSSRFHGIAHLRHKESDRIEALTKLLERAGAGARAGESCLIVDGPIRLGDDVRVLPTARDHRIAMAAALLSLRSPRCLIENPACVSKSYPAFFRDLDALCVRSRA